MKRFKNIGLMVIIFVGMSVSNPHGALPEPLTSETKWLVDYIEKIPPVLMKEPFLELLGQTDRPVPYTFREAVKLAGHSCGAVAGAWVITRKALQTLYPDTLPVRGRIKVTMPGAEDEWYVGVFGEVITYLTGAAPKTGFPGAEFGQAYNRRNLMNYREKPSGIPPAKMVWIFERIDTGAKVAIRYDLNQIKPPQTPERTEMGAKVASRKATPEEVREWREYWNARAKFVLDHGDTLTGFFVVEKLH
ncbi:MAG: hypothetical protein KG012_15435 [Deltaproteobacteria bacterium]|nr:hypothetical protein [Deltaproteobacteria bacterium]